MLSREQTVGWATFMVPITKVTCQVALFYRIPQVTAEFASIAVARTLSAPHNAAFLAAYTTMLICYTACFLSSLLRAYTAIAVADLQETAHCATNYIRGRAANCMSYTMFTIYVLTHYINRTTTATMPYVAHAMCKLNMYTNMPVTFV